VARQALAFISYDPYTDQRIDPVNASDIYKFTEIPICLHDAVRRAKHLVNKMPINDLKKCAQMVEGYISMGSSYQVNELNVSGRSYCSSSMSDDLRAFLQYADHDESVANKPILFGVLTLCLAGEIINTLYPSNKHNQQRNDKSKVFKGLYVASDEYRTEIVMELAIEAVRSSGFGEGLLLASNFKKEKSHASEQSRRKKNLIYDLFCDWAMSQPKSHGFLQTEDAVNLGFRFYLANSTEFSYLAEKVKDSTHNRLKKNLEDYCVVNQKDYPFPRPRSKRKI
jgi:hypothetical protein